MTFGRLIRVLSLILTTIAVASVEAENATDRPLQTIAAQPLAGLTAPVRVVRDADRIPHLFAQNDLDGYLVLGYLHAQDRLFQMDYTRRLFSGTLAELAGQSALASDIEFRTLGLRRAAEESWPAYPPEIQARLQAYADGVNAYLAQGDALPPEYDLLELTAAAVWTPIDTLTVGNGISLSLSFSLLDLSLTETFQAYVNAGQMAGFDGQRLFFEDLFRSAPFDATVSIPNMAMGSLTGQFGQSQAVQAASLLSPESTRLASQYLRKVEHIPGLSTWLSSSPRKAGSNWILISGSLTQSGQPLFANDPHLGLGMPAIFYEVHLHVSNDPVLGPMTVNGVTFPGVPTFVQGCNTRICWGSTVNPMDVTDFYTEELSLSAVDAPSGCSIFGLTVTASRFQDQEEPVVLIPQRFQVNQVGNAVPDDLVAASVGPLDGGCTVIIPRRNHGPILAVDPDLSTLFTGRVNAISIQYTGFRITRNSEAFLHIARARNVQEFRDALQFFDVGSQNFGYADIDGNIAYFTSAELPLRADLQAGVIDGGVPPFFVRDGIADLKPDGTRNRHEWLRLSTPQPEQALAFEILPFDEMPQVINPSQGFILSANNDPSGVTLDNNALNQRRLDGGILYLNPGYTSLRMGRLRRLVEDRLVTTGQALLLDDMRHLQGNHQLLDAEVLTPFIFDAFDHAQTEGVGEPLRVLGAEPRLQEAVGRLAQWNFSTPTGIRDGYDPGDDPNHLPEPSSDEIADSVAATIYSMWRGQILSNTIDAILDTLGLGAFRPDSERSMAALRHLLETFAEHQGIGSSGVDFFDVADLASAAERRDFLILKSLLDALDLLSSDTFAVAFGRSTNQNDYRWGRLHRIVFGHLLNTEPFNVPNGGGLADLADGLPGVARSGGYEVVDASSHAARAAAPNAFMFGSGPARRFVGELLPEGINAFQMLAGGQSGVPTSPDYTSQLGRWLTNQYHPLRLTPEGIEADAVEETVFMPITVSRP